MTALSDLKKLFAGGRQNLAPWLRHHDHILDSDPPSVREVNPGLYGDHHPRPQDLGLSGSYAWRLVNFQPHAVTSRMREVFPSTASLQ
jgi:hypothetical protein